MNKFRKLRRNIIGRYSAVKSGQIQQPEKCDAALNALEYLKEYKGEVTKIVDYYIKTFREMGD